MRTWGHGDGDVRAWGCGMWLCSDRDPVVPITRQTLLHSPQHHLWVLHGALLLFCPPLVGATCTPPASRSSLSLSPPPPSPVRADPSVPAMGSRWEQHPGSPHFPACPPAQTIPPGLGNQAKTFPGVSQQGCPAGPPAAHVYFCSRKAQARSLPLCMRSPQTGVTSKHRDLFSTVYQPVTFYLWGSEMQKHITSSKEQRSAFKRR